MRPSLALAALLALAPGVAAAHVVSDREVRLLRAIPTDRLEALIGPAEPDAEGRISANRAAWTHAVHQIPAYARLAAASAASDTARALAMWAAVEAALARQSAHGDVAASAAADAEAALALWAAELARTIVVVQNGPLAKPMWKHTTPAQAKLRRTVDRLATSADAYHRAHRRDAARLLLQARLFLLADGIFHVPEYARIGQSALAAALALQRDDGALAGRDAPGAHARALESLEVLALYFPAPFLERAAARAAAWLAPRAGAIGRGAPPRAADPAAIVDGRDDPARRAAIALEWHRGRLALGPPPRPVPGAGGH